MRRDKDSSQAVVWSLLATHKDLGDTSLLGVVITRETVNRLMTVEGHRESGSRGLLRSLVERVIVDGHALKRYSPTKYSANLIPRAQLALF